MVPVFNKEALCWYVVTLKLRERVEAVLPKSLPNSPSSKPLLLLTRGGGKPTPHPSAANSEWLISIREKLEEARQDETSRPWAKLSIYRIPQFLRVSEDKVYIPQIVSLGPYYHADHRLREMERHKWRALYQVLNRTGHKIERYLDAVKTLEDRARTCYEGSISLSSDEFVQIMVLDGIFVLELFRGTGGEGFKQLGYCHNDPVFAIRGTMHSIQRDMIMLENQIPLFILDRLLGVQIGRTDRCGLVGRLALRFFDPLMPTDEPIRKIDSDFDPLSDCGLHCLDVFRESLLRTGPEPLPRIWIRRWSHARKGLADKRRQQLVHCVSELRESGIKFRRRKTDRFWDIKFKDGVVKIPRLLIHDGTKSLFLNLIAFEQCHMDCSNDITSYVIFMDNLINSEEDVGYLHYHGIIEHWLGNDGEVADLFNRLCQEVIFDINDSYLSGLSEQVNRYYNYRWNTWRASLKHKYFNNPWATMSFVAALVLLLLTFAQTFFSVYPYYRPSP